MDEKTTKCVKCHHGITTQEGIKTPKGIMCKACVRKQKLTRLSIVASVLLVLIAGSIVYYSQTQKNEVVGFDGVSDIQDSTTVIIEQPVKKFQLEETVAQSNPVTPGQTVDNIESFKRTFSKNINEAQKNNTGNIIIPNIKILFDFNSTDISLIANNLLIEYAKAYLQTNKQAIILVEGYTCDYGSIEVNDNVSKCRADAVRQILVSNGIPTNKIETRWYGKSMNKNFSYSNIKDYRRATISIK